MSFSSQKHLERAILEAIVYFELFDYPLTTLEVWSNLRIKADYGEVHSALQSSNYLESKNGFWHLKSSLRNGAPLLNDERARRYRTSKYKLDKARKFVHFLKWVPWIQAVYACNSLGFLDSRAESDIDFFIVARAGRIWSARFFTVLLVKLFGKRPTDKQRRDTFCFSFYAVDGADMRRAAIENDIYYLYWNAKLIPLFVRGNAAERFWARNRWITKELPQAESIQMPASIIVKKPMARPWAPHGLAMRKVERALRAFQLRVLPARYKKMANRGTSVILNDEFLKFHNHDRREHFKNEFKRRLANVVE